MVLESTIVCVDNSEYMRNGDFLPTRLQAQQDAVSLICHSKTRSNPENNVGLLTLAKPEVLATLTTDVGRILSKLHLLQPNGCINFLTGIRIAHLALKHRQGKNHKMRLVIFVGSPIEADEKELVKVAKRLKKEKVNVDIVNFGEDAVNTEKLTLFINTVNGKEGSGSHLITVPLGPHLSDALISSPVFQGEDGGTSFGLGSSGFEFGIDPNEDPELALALRVSMEEQRQRQEEEARRVAVESVNETTTQPSVEAQTLEDGEAAADKSLLEKALAMSLDVDDSSEDRSSPAVPDFSSMSEEEQVAFAMQMSLQHSMEQVDSQGSNATSLTSMETEPVEHKKDDTEDYSEVMNDPEFLKSVLENLPGVDPQSEAIQNAMGTLTQTDTNKPKKDSKKDSKNKKGKK